MPDLTTTTYKEVIMALHKPNDIIDAQLYELECISYALTTLEQDGTEMPAREVLSGFGLRLSKIHADFKARLLS